MASSQLVEISNECTPINVLEDDYAENQTNFMQRKKAFENAQQNKSPFLIGSIEAVNKRVSRLDRKLQNYTALVVESRSTDKTEESIDYTYFLHQHDEELSKRYENRLKEVQDVNQFAGIYSLKSTFLSKPSERVKQISKISLSPTKPMVQKSEKGKPKFVELHVYPGYFQNALTPFPNEVLSLEILLKVTTAQAKLQKTPLYKPEFEKLFYSQMSQAILQDSYWWLFLDKWQQRAKIQQELFNRIAHNYVKLMTYAKYAEYGDTFLKDYPSLLGQGLYAAFCATFPDSYRQFDDNFKETIVCMVCEWITGNRPAPCTWRKWNFEKLEPHNIKMREELLRQAQDRKNMNSSLIDFSSCEQPNSIVTDATLQQGASVSSFATNNGKPVKTKTAPCMNRRANKYSDQQRKTNQTPLDIYEEEAKGPKVTKGNNHSKINVVKRQVQQESHPACKGPEFIHASFDIHGRSPLVAQFLRMKHLQPDIGMLTRVQRTEIEKLPPVNHPTYQDIIKQAYKRSREIENNYIRHVENEKKERRKFVVKQRAVNNDYIRREAQLLSQKREVKRLSDLIMLELKKDKDSVSAGAAFALEAALLAVE